MYRRRDFFFGLGGIGSRSPADLNRSGVSDPMPRSPVVYLLIILGALAGLRALWEMAGKE